jgi:hypothetical protein
MWARFMTAATRDNKAERFAPPRSVSAATICPLSGKLATDGCYRDQASVYTEVFERGTEPTEYCPYHTIHAGSPIRLASGELAPAPPPAGGSPAAAGVVTASVPAATPSQAEAAATTATVQEAPQKKRGFWSRVFGIGR